MTNYEAAFETLKSSLRPRLREFLEEEGIKISKNGMLKCINPSHADKNASMKLLSDLNEEQVWCYGCQATGDIFTANYWLNKAPLTGLEFIQENVSALAKKFGIPFEEITLSEEQIERLEQYRFNGIVAEKLTLKDERGQPVNWSHSHCEARGWNLRTCEKLGVATILDYNKLLRDIQHSTGMTIEQIEKKGVSSNLFGPDMITITLFDERGKVVGFTARNTKWTKDSESSKYCNSSHSQVFQKGKILYGMNFVRNSRHRRLDIFEGNGSFITAYAAGHNSCVALCGSSLSDEQVDLIIDMGFSHINLVMDNDPTGKEKTDFYMQKLSGIEGLRVECTRLVFKEEHSHLKDPDDFIRTYSLGEFYKLKPVSAFDWYLEKESEAVKNNQLNPSDFAKKMVKVIYNTENRIDRARQRQKLSEITGIPERDIEAEMERQVKVSVNDVKNNLSKKLSGAKSVDEITVILDSARDSMSETLDYKETAKSLSVEESLRSFDDCITVLENKKPGIQGWITGFSLLDTKLSGVPKPVGFDEHGNKIPIPGSSFGFAGAPQHGKSTILQNIILNIAKRNEDVVVLYWCLDDSRQRVTERLLAMDSKVNWNKITRRVPITEDEKKEVEKSITTLKELVSSGRFVMKDQSNGNTLSFLFKWVEMTKEMTDKPILVCIDSFHKIVSKVESGGNDYTAVKKNSQDLKKFIQSHCVTILASLELNKTAARGLEPDLMSITEARKIEYDFDIIATVYNNYYDMDGESTQVITKPTGERSPLIKFNLRKTKDGGSGPVYFALDTGNFSITDYSVDDISNLTNHEPIRPVTNGEIRIVPHDVGGLKPILTPVGRRYKKSGDDKSAAEPWHKS